MLLVSWFTATNMEVNLYTYHDISLQLVKPSALYKATSDAKNLNDEIDLHDVTISNGPTQPFEPELHSDGVRRSLLDSVMPWAAGRLVDLWVVVCVQGMVRKIEAQNLYYLKEWNILYIEYNISWDTMDVTMWSTNTHIRTCTCGNILNHCLLGKLSTQLKNATYQPDVMYTSAIGSFTCGHCFWFVQPCASPNSATGYMFHWVQYRKIASLTTNQFPNTAKSSSSVFLAKTASTIPTPMSYQKFIWDLSHRISKNLFWICRIGPTRDWKSSENWP